MKKQLSKIDQNQISRIVTSLAQISPLFNELIPSFTTRYTDKLQQCLTKAQTQKKAVSQISCLFFLINKDRPFPTGNKRIALAVLLYMLDENKMWLKADSEKMYSFAHWVASAPEDSEEEVIRYIEKFIEKNKVRLRGK